MLRLGRQQGHPDNSGLGLALGDELAALETAGTVRVVQVKNRYLE